MCQVLCEGFNGLGRRFEKNVNGTLTRYVYDGEDILFEFSGSTGSPLALRARYAHGAGIDEPLLMERDLSGNRAFETSERFFYHTEGLGSVTDLTNSTGVISKSYLYDSFGQIVSQSGTLENPFRYTGREFDAESGLYFYRARYYDPRTGRFLSEDPIGYSDGMNLFSYTRNNPLNFIDPFGLQCVLEQELLIVTLVSSIPVLINYYKNHPLDLRLDFLLSSPNENSGEGNNSGAEQKTEVTKHPDGSSTEVTPRKNPGTDSGQSRIRKEKDANGNTKEVWHEVYKDGKVVHRDWKGPGSKPPKKPIVR